jgi:L-lactate dehydrogenase complex protein LldE
VDLFVDQPEWLAKAKDLADRSHELLSFLTDVRGVKTVNANYPNDITYHDSCSGLRELGIKKQPRELLSSVNGLQIKEMNNSDVCCGFGGTFCVKFPEISTRMASDKVENIEQSGAETLLGGDLGCLLNISGRLKRLGKTTRVYHTAEVLADMTDVPALGDGEEG